MSTLKGDIRIVHDPSAKLPDELPAFLTNKSHKAKSAYRVLRDLMGSHNMSESMADFYTLTEVPMAVIDLDANVLASSKWEPICTDFFRVNPDTCKRCVESDIVLANRLDEGAEFTMYKCKNGLVDCASPILIDNEHVANLFIGQFFTQKPDRSFFRKQIKKFGFDSEAFMSALNEVTIVDETKVPSIMSYLKKFSQMVATMAYDRYRTVESEKEHRKRLEAMIADRTKQLQIIDNFQTQFIAQSDPFDMYEHLRDELLTLTDSEIGFIGETQSKEDGTLFLKVYALSNIAWDEETNNLYNTYRKRGFEFIELDNLFGRVVTEKKVILSNEPGNDRRAAGLPTGHPSLNSFLGIPVFYGERLVGEIGLANRPGGYDQKIVDLLKPLSKTCGQIIVARQEKEAREKAESEREKFIAELSEAIQEIRTLSGLLPICSSCKKIRDDKGYWNQIESYISKHSKAEFTHSICPECAKKIYPGLYNKKYANPRNESDDPGKK